MTGKTWNEPATPPVFGPAELDRTMFAGTGDMLRALRCLFILILLPHFVYAQDEGDGCYRSAERWIAGLEGDGRTILRKHAQSNCGFAHKWIERDDGGESQRQRLCTDLVLIWTHKECIYFRDYINYAAYEPCEEWSRELYRRCLDPDEDEWFAR